MSDVIPTDNIRGVLTRIEALSATLVPDYTVLVSPDHDNLAIMLALLRKAMQEVKDACMFVEDELVKVMPGKQIEVAGLGVVEMHTGASRKEWDKEGLIDAMVHSIEGQLPNLVNADSGEVVNLIDHVRALVEMFTDAATPSWKVTGLRKWGVDPDEYCTTTWGRKTIETPSLPTAQRPLPGA